MQIHSKTLRVVAAFASIAILAIVVIYAVSIDIVFGGDPADRPLVAPVQAVALLVAPWAVLGAFGLGGYFFFRGASNAFAKLLCLAQKSVEGSAPPPKPGEARPAEILSIEQSVKNIRDDLATADEELRLTRFQTAAFAGSSKAMMIVDRDFIVKFANDATTELFRRHREVFKETWPSFDPDNVIGTCIDMFHKDPGHQRRMLADPSVLPHRTDISIGELKIELNVSGVFGADGDYLGNVLEWDDVTEERMNAGLLAALDRTQAMIEFTLDGVIINANDNFLRTMGCRLDEIKGQHHRMFMDEGEAFSEEYKEHWRNLARGETIDGKFRRVANGGREVWLKASYNPVLDVNGTPFRIVKFATDITAAEEATRRNDEERKKHAAEQELVVEALADGLNRISVGDLTAEITTSFNENYEQLRSDFNAAVDKMRIADRERQKNEAAQNLVVQELANGLKALAAGDLLDEINEPFSEEYEELRLDFNLALAGMRDAVSVISKTAGGIHRGAREIAQAADDLSRRTENRASALEETAASMRSILEVVTQTTEGTDQANSRVADTCQEARQSGEVVLKAVDAMSEIEKSSLQISQIIGVIDDIAFQTNLLALNAGVEAARAGDAGRGFAVVAQEVRALAQRASEAAKEIKNLITNSSDHVSRGVELVGQAGSALEDIVKRVEGIRELVSEIAVSSVNQSASISEVNIAVSKMDDVTQQNAAMVEESTAASHCLTSDAEELLKQISHFKANKDEQIDQKEADEVVPAVKNKAAATSVGDQQKAVAAFISEPEERKAAVANGSWEDF